MLGLEVSMYLDFSAAIVKYLPTKNITQELYFLFFFIIYGKL